MNATATKPIKLPLPPRAKPAPRQKGEDAAKICSTCEQLLTICSFNIKSRSPLRRRHDCRSCQGQAARRSYERNRESVIERSMAARSLLVASHRTWLHEFLLASPCVDCGLIDPAIMEFDHRHGVKSDTVSRMLQQGCSLERIQAEIAKCDVLCPNCHRKRTQADQHSYRHLHMTGLLDAKTEAAEAMPQGTRLERQTRSLALRRQRNRIDTIEYLEAHPCVDCAEADIRVLEFDHVRGTKQAELWKLVSGGAKLTTLHAERDKCDVRCANCHRRKSGNARQVQA